MLYNLVLFRDERTLNITALLEESLILNATGFGIVQEYFNRPFRITLFIDGPVFQTFQVFNVTFIDRYNTSIMLMNAQSASPNVQLNSFYNCGQNNLNYILSDSLNGPFYDLESVLVRNHYFTITNQSIKKKLTVNHDFNFCKVNFLFPYTTISWGIQ